MAQNEHHNQHTKRTAANENPDHKGPNTLERAEAVAVGGLILIGTMLSLSNFHKAKIAAVWVFFGAYLILGMAVAIRLTREYSASAPNSLDKPSDAPLETPRLSRIAAPSHKITDNAFEIIGKINQAGPLQKEDVINSYINGSIDWKVGFHSIKAVKGDGEHIEARFVAFASRPPSSPFIVCMVSRKEYAYLDKTLKGVSSKY